MLELVLGVMVIMLASSMAVLAVANGNAEGNTEHPDTDGNSEHLDPVCPQCGDPMVFREWNPCSIPFLHQFDPERHRHFLAAWFCIQHYGTPMP